MRHSPVTPHFIPFVLLELAGVRQASIDVMRVGRVVHFPFNRRKQCAAFSMARAVTWGGTSGAYNSADMKLEVECYSGHKGDERPVQFRIDDHEYRVEEVLDHWYSPEDTWFKLRAHDGNLYILKRRMGPESNWDLVSFRKAAG